MLGLVIVACGHPPTDGTGREYTVTKADRGEAEFVPDRAPSLNHAELLDRILYQAATPDEAQAALDMMAASRDLRFIAGLIDTLRYHPALKVEIGRTLNRLTGQDLPPTWGVWVEWAGKNAAIPSFDDYSAWKAELFEKIDPQFKRFVHAGMKIAPGARVEEIVWGGVRVDGIPALDNPKMVVPEAAGYLIPDEKVFGVRINGDARAYPTRFLDWHEMFNDVIGGQPVTLAY